MNSLPQEIIDRIAIFVEAPTYDDNSTSWHPNGDQESRARLANLRLVNYRFCQGAAIRLYRVVHMHDRRPKRLEELCGSRYKSNVKQICLRFCFSNWTPDILGSTRKLLCSLSTIPSITALYITIFTRRLTWGWPYNEAEDMRMSAALTTIFEQFSSGQLKKVCLRLPGVAEVPWEGGPSILVAVFGKLRSLNLQICPHERGFITTNKPVGFEWIGLARNLESLRLQSTAGSSWTDMKYLDTKHLCRLHTIELVNMKVTEAQLTGIIVKQNQYTLKDITLAEMALTHGSWKTLCLAMCKLPNLIEMDFHDNGYFTSEHLFRFAMYRKTDDEENNFFRRHHDHDMDYEFTYDDDYEDDCALGDLQRHVNANRRRNNLLQYRKERYRFVKEVPFKLLLPEDYTLTDENAEKELAYAEYIKNEDTEELEGYTTLSDERPIVLLDAPKYLDYIKDAALGHENE
ncbi:hypothetical protein BT63DRAFT_478528 [Microthyrium microscopicum]|uniref:Uncharacterized protein n=1 Tax=Microthyrium microscopicum TaxID=703497 RepID=A0A6A6UFM6_9PEZI|nr:hypothetical protein BT63DRAFT_478528 [Microthyrium microscopicum]